MRFPGRERGDESRDFLTETSKSKDTGDLLELLRKTQPSYHPKMLYSNENVSKIKIILHSEL